MINAVQIISALLGFAGVVFLGTALSLIGVRFYREQPAAPVILGLACLALARLLIFLVLPHFYF